MRQANKRIAESAEKTVRDIRRATRRHHSAEEKRRQVRDRGRRRPASQRRRALLRQAPNGGEDVGDHYERAEGRRRCPGAGSGVMPMEYVIRDGQRIEVETLAGRVVPKRRRADQHVGRQHLSDRMS